MSDATLAVIVVEEKVDRSQLLQQYKPFLAWVAGNFNIRAQGATREEALAGVRKQVMSLVRLDEVKSVDVVAMQFDELIVASIMGQ